MSEDQQVPDEEELRRALEEQMRNARVEDLLVQSTVSLINLSARRIAIEEERDLGQARLGIDAVAALVDLLPEEVTAQVRDALSQLRLQFAQISGNAKTDASDQVEAPSKQPGSSGLWTPPGVS